MACLNWNTKYTKMKDESVDAGGENLNHLKLPKGIKKVNKQEYNFFKLKVM